MHNDHAHDHPHDYGPAHDHGHSHRNDPAPDLDGAMDRPRDDHGHYRVHDHHAADGHDHGHSDDHHDHGNSHDGHSHDGHSHDGHSHDGHSHDGHSHDGHSHDGHSHDGHSHDGHSHDGHSHDHAHDGVDGGKRRKKGKRKNPKTGPSENPQDASEQLVSKTLRGRESNCSHGCGSDGVCGTDGACATGGCGVGSLLTLIANKFDYTDTRRIIEVTFKGARKSFVHVEDEEVPIRVRDTVIVNVKNGLDHATVTMVGSLVHAKRKAKRLTDELLPTVLRLATEEDLKKIDQNRASELQAYNVCKSRVQAFELPMELVDAEWQFDHRKVTFYFTAEGRVDFRELVRDLAAIFNTRIELRQISVRDAAKRVGGMGICGRELCCTTHLGRYQHITLDHAKIQQLAMNPSKLSGQCGRLKCCLLYEIDTYVEGLKRFPPLETRVVSEHGRGTIQKIDVLREQLSVFYPESGTWSTLTIDEYNALVADGKKNRRKERAEAA